MTANERLRVVRDGPSFLRQPSQDRPRIFKSGSHINTFFLSRLSLSGWPPP